MLGCLLHKKIKGISLIITVSVMMLLAVMAVTFTRMTLYDQAATGNYCSTIDAKLAAFAGFDFAIAKIYGDLRANGYINWTTNYTAGTQTWEQTAYPSASNTELKTASETTGQKVSLHMGSLSNINYSGMVGRKDASNNIWGTYELSGNTYALKISPSAGKFNVNSHIAGTDSDQQKSNIVMRNILTTLAEKCGVSAGTRPNLVNKIRTASYNTTSCNPSAKPYSSMGALIQNLESGGYHLTDATIKKFVGNLCTDSWINPNTCGTYRGQWDDCKATPSFYTEKRAPVDINSVSDELMQTLLYHLQACVFLNDSSAATDAKTGAGTLPRAVNINFQSQANNITSELLYTGSTRKVFKTQKDIEDAIDGIGNGTINSITTDDVSWAWDSGNTKRTMCRDALKSAFSPNFIDNCFNPTGDAYRIACKGDIYKKTSGDPGHTTELCCAPMDAQEVEINSLGRITANGRTRTVGLYSVTGKIKCVEVIHHSTQKQFVDAKTGGTNVVTYPVYDTTVDQDKYSGWIELKPQDISAGSAAFGFTAQGSASGNVKKLSDSFESFNGNITKLLSFNQMYKSTTRDVKSNLIPDGLMSKYRWYVDTTSTTSNKVPNSYYFVRHAFSDYPSVTDIRTVTGNVGNYKGAIEFWIKLTETEFGVSGAKGVACGLIKVSTRGKSSLVPTIPEDHSAASSSASTAVKTTFWQGVDLFAYINTQKTLCASRMYWGVYWDNGSDTLSVNKSGSSTWIGSKFNKDSDPKRTYGRVDITIPDLDWKAHEWHHVCITWDDEDKSKYSRLQVYIDGNLKSSNPEPILHKSSDYNPNWGQFCVCNEINPQDSFFINGFARKQDSNTSGNQNSDYPSVFPECNGRMDFPGNSTMDNLISWNTKVTSGFPSRRYPAAGGNYQGRFTISGFAADSSFFIGPLLWTGYSLTNLSGSCTESGISGSSTISGMWTPNVYKAKKNGEYITYQINLNLPAGDDRKGVALDSVSVILYRAYPKILEFSENYNSN